MDLGGSEGGAGTPQNQCSWDGRTWLKVSPYGWVRRAREASTEESEARAT